VHQDIIYENDQTRCNIVGYCSLAAVHVSSDNFAHHQEHLNCIIPAAVNKVYMLLTMSENIARNMYSSEGTINYPTVLHLVGRFRIL